MDTYAPWGADAASTLHAAIVSSSDDAIISKSLDGTIRSWNAAAERLFGYSASEAIGRPISLIIPARKLVEEAQIIQRLSRGERIETFETIRVAKDGHEADISLTVSPLVDKSGRVFGASKVARDITARKRAEQSLQRQDAQLRLLWETAGVLFATERPDAMLRGVFDKIAPFLHLDAYLNFMVTPAGDALSLESWAGIRDEDAEPLRRLKIGAHWSGNEAAGDGVDASEEQTALIARRLGFRACSSNALIVEGRLLGTLVFVSRQEETFRPDDIEFLETICHYVTAAYERVSLIGRLRDTDQRKDEFLAVLAHELRNPLAPIRNALEIIRVDGRDHSAVEQAAQNMIERQLEQMVRLVDDLLDVSRITHGRLELRKEPVELAAVINSAIDTARPLIASMRHELVVTLPPKPIYFDADPMRLAQVFSNLLNNAAKYMDPGGRIWLTAAHADSTVTVTVRDTGMGIPAEALPRIFEMFVRADSSRDRSQAGLGIGLTLVKRLLGLHGGTVEARSEGAGRGAEFIVRLPVVALPATTQPSPLAAAPRRSPITPRILVADDNRDAAEAMSMLLRLMGSDVRTVYDGARAVTEAEEFRPDLILLDIGMPRLNGYEVARRIREQPWSQGTVLVALTGWGQDEDKRKAAEAGFDQHFTKPLDPAVLQKLVSDFRAE